MEGFLEKLSISSEVVDLTKLTDTQLKAYKHKIENEEARYNVFQHAKKIQLNSAYGACGSEYFAYYDIRTAEAVTLSGQLSIRWIEKKLNEYMNRLLRTEDVDYVIYADTDSIYLDCEKLVLEVCGNSSVEEKVNFIDKFGSTELQKIIDSSYQELAEYVNAYAQKMRMKRECIAESGFWQGKKRYALNIWDNEGVRYSSPKMKPMGIEIVRSATPKFVREKLKEAVEIILSKDEQTLKKFVDETYEGFRNAPLSEIAFPRGVNTLDKYFTPVGPKKGTQAHIRAAIIYNMLLEQLNISVKYEKINQGDKIKFIWLKQPNLIGSDVIAFVSELPEEFEIHQSIDYHTQFDKSFKKPILAFANAVGWTLNKTINLFEI